MVDLGCSIIDEEIPQMAGMPTLQARRLLKRLQPDQEDAEKELKQADTEVQRSRSEAGFWRIHSTD